MSLFTNGRGQLAINVAIQPTLTKVVSAADAKRLFATAASTDAAIAKMRSAGTASMLVVGAWNQFASRAFRLAQAATSGFVQIV